MDNVNEIKVWFSSKFNLDIKCTFNTFTGVLKTTYISKEIHEGFPSHLHGGIIASIFDESQGILCQEYGLFAMTKELNINYYKKVPLFIKELHLESKITKVQQKNVYTKSILYDPKLPNVIFAESRASWYLLRFSFLERYLGTKKNTKEIGEIMEYFNYRKERSKRSRKK